MVAEVAVAPRGHGAAAEGGAQAVRPHAVAAGRAADAPPAAAVAVGRPPRPPSFRAATMAGPHVQVLVEPEAAVEDADGALDGAPGPTEALLRPVVGQRQGVVVRRVDAAACAAVGTCAVGAVRQAAAQDVERRAAEVHPPAEVAMVGEGGLLVVCAARRAPKVGEGIRGAVAATKVVKGSQVAGVRAVVLRGRPLLAPAALGRQETLPVEAAKVGSPAGVGATEGPASGVAAAAAVAGSVGLRDGARPSSHRACRAPPRAPQRGRPSLHPGVGAAAPFTVGAAVAGATPDPPVHGR